MTGHPQFLLFPNLPKELRLMIWKEALPGPRIVGIKQVHLEETIGQWEQRTGKRWPERYEESVEWNDHTILVDMAMNWNEDRNANLVGIVSTTPPPSMLFVSKEAREVIVPHYPLVFRCTGSSPRTRFNFKIDTLYLRYDTFPCSNAKEGLVKIARDLEIDHPIQDTANMRKVRNLAILSYIDPYPLYPFHLFSFKELVAIILGSFCQIKELTIVSAQIGTNCTLNTRDWDPQISLEKSWRVENEWTLVNRIELLEYWKATERSCKNVVFSRDTAHIEASSLSMTDLERCRRYNGHRGGYWDVPIIHEKVMVPQSVKEEIQKANL